MRNIRITVQYEGTRYRGWQRLGDSENTIQGKLEKLLTRFCGEPVQVIGSGRTDAGVHALAQTANFHTSCSASPEEIQDAFSEFLPEDIAVTGIEDVPERFHSRYNAKSKTYRYRLDRGAVADVFARRYALHLADRLDSEAMRQAAASLCGKYDFRSFTNSRYRNKSTVRNLQSIEIIKRGYFLDLKFTGEGFLHNMIRILAGTLVAVGRGELAASAMPEIIKARDRHASGSMLPPHGLTLLRVEY